MNFEQARELSFLVPWKVAECFSGPQCWCRRIVPVDPIPYNDEYENFGKILVSTETEEYEVIPDAAIDQKTAEYIVRLHNLYITKEIVLNLTEEQKENFKEEWDKLNTGPKSISIIEMNEMVETFEKLWENKHSKIRKIVRKEID